MSTPHGSLCKQRQRMRVSMRNNLQSEQGRASKWGTNSAIRKDNTAKNITRELPRDKTHRREDLLLTEVYAVV